MSAVIFTLISLCWFSTSSLFLPFVKIAFWAEKPLSQPAVWTADVRASWASLIRLGKSALWYFEISVVFFKFLFWQCSTMPFLFPCSVQILQNIKSFSWLYLSHEYNLNHLGINLLVGGCFGVSSRGAGFVWSFELFSDSSELPRNTSIIERWSFDRQSFFFGGIADDYLTDYSNRNHAKKMRCLPAS